jgi:hypothetical protein
MSIGAIATLVLALALAAPARSEVKSVTPSGFEVATVTTIAAPAERVYAGSARSPVGGARLTPSRRTPRTSVSSCAPAAAFASD